MWKYIELAQTFVKLEVRNGATNSFWYDWWSSRGRLIDVSGIRGSIDLWIPIHISVEFVLWNHRRRRHGQERYNTIEEVINEQRRKGLLNGEDVVLWKKKDDTFQPKFNSKATWHLIRERDFIKEWWKGMVLLCHAKICLPLVASFSESIIKGRSNDCMEHWSQRVMCVMPKLAENSQSFILYLQFHGGNMGELGS